eukprot:PLAT15588.1.p1 GENE.PLAT15588.1~~PLAT15588.1.p1  ORF type:complete len:511 (+),score=223.11 PLAT15588.1:49-1581(+)
MTSMIHLGTALKLAWANVAGHHELLITCVVMGLTIPLLIRQSNAGGVKMPSRISLRGVIVWLVGGIVAGLLMAVSFQLTRAQMKSAKLKTTLHRDELRSSFRRLQEAIAKEVKVIQQAGSAIVPEVSFEDVANGRVSAEAIAEIKRRGVVIVRGTVDEEQVGKWREQLDDYLTRNPQHYGYPIMSRPQIYEIYYAPPQVAARQHENMATVRSWMNKLWRYRGQSPRSGEEELFFDPDRDYTYMDRLRIRTPGDENLKLTTHMDAGSLDRWSEPSYQAVYSRILAGDWEAHDPWDAAYRAFTSEAELPNKSTFFRAFQGWMAVTQQGKDDGTLEVVPMLREGISYTMLRPFQQDVWSGDFCGAAEGLSNIMLYPSCHAELLAGKVTIPTVRPGDTVWWHPDLVHAVERKHAGEQNSTVFYIPAGPMCEKNAKYIARQRDAFLQGATPPDFPSLDAEKDFDGRATWSDLSALGRKQMGFDDWSLPHDDDAVRARLHARVNELLPPDHLRDTA